jgi:PleD family two-component response regulator
VALLDDLATVAKSSYECGIRRILKQLEPKEAQALIKLIDEPETSATSLARVLTNNGFPVSRQTINRHRARGIKDTGCVCK